MSKFYLTNATNAPADKTSIYSTAYIPNDKNSDTSFTNPLPVKFAQSVNNFLLDVLNGCTQDTSYSVADNAGHSATFTLPPKLKSGQKQILKKSNYLDRYPLQITAYCGALNRMYDTKIKHGVIVVALPKAEAQVFQFQLGDYWQV